MEQGSHDYAAVASEPRSRTASDIQQTGPRDVKHQACDTCKRRKIRCSGGNPCQHCRRSGAACQYTLSHGRLAITERRLARCEQRMLLLEAAWRRFVPGVDLADALHAVESQPQASSPFGSNEASVSPEPTTDTRGLHLSNAWGMSAPQPSSAIERESEKADTFEWDESTELDSLTDGIGSLSVDPKGTGYMGPQSGNALLRYLSSIAAFFPVPEDDRGSQLESVNSAESAASKELAASSTFTHCCIDWYFKYFHSAYPILHEGFFRAQFVGALPKPKDGSWPVLMNIVLAFGAFTGPARSKNVDFYYYGKARECLSVDLLQRGSLSLVQAFALMANYLQKRDKPNTGFTYLGLAYNMALGIGLHREFSETASSAFIMEIRRRVWWTLFIFDSGARLTFGRPSMMLRGVNVQVPRNLHDTDLTVDLDELPTPRNIPTVTSSLIWQSELAEISNLANAKLLETRFPDRSLMLSLDDRVRSWRDTLPLYFRVDSLDAGSEWFDIPRMILLWRSMHLRIVMTRPFLLGAVQRREILEVSHADDPVRRCIQAAEECVQSIISFWNGQDSHPGSLVWYATYWLVTAVFVNVTCLLYDPYHASASAWIQQVEDSKLVLRGMGIVEPTAQRAASILEKILDLVPRSPDPASFSFNEPIRMDIADMWSQSFMDPSIMDQSFEIFEPT